MNCPRYSGAGVPRRKALMRARRFLVSMRRSFAALVGLVGRRGLGRTAAWRMRRMSRSRACARLRSCVRCSCAMITSTPLRVSLRPASLLKGEGTCSFAVNRRENPEAEVPKMLAEGKPLKGAVDHYVPVLAVKGESGKLLAVLFGYACHPTTLSFNTWCGDYPGFAQVNLEANHPGTTAMFFNACGGDQNPIPRRKVKLCERYGKMLSDAVEKVLAERMQPVSSGLGTAYELIELAFDELVTREKLLPIANGRSPLHARWANRMLKKIEEGVTFPTSYPYPVQAWQIGNELLLIGIGGEAVVDYSLRFKREFGPATWVCGYANYMAAYIPSRRVWEEGGYEGGPHLDEYGHPAWRWAGDVQDRIAAAVNRVVQEAKRKSRQP